MCCLDIRSHDALTVVIKGHVIGQRLIFRREIRSFVLETAPFLTVRGFAFFPPEHSIAGYSSNAQEQTKYEDHVTIMSRNMRENTLEEETKH